MHTDGTVIRAIQKSVHTSRQITKRCQIKITLVLYNQQGRIAFFFLCSSKLRGAKRGCLAPTNWRFPGSTARHRVRDRIRCCCVVIL